MAQTDVTPGAKEVFEMWAHLQPNQHCYLTVTDWGTYQWRDRCGNFHRVDENGVQDGPATIRADGRQIWCLDGSWHRLDGPAWIDQDGSPDWYLDDEWMTQEEWAADPRVIAYHSQTQEGAEEWLAKM